VRSAVPALLLSSALLLVTGCGATKASSLAELRLQREDLIAVSHALKTAEGPVAGEVAATKLAWPLVANGLPADTSSLARPPIAAATRNAARVKVPAIMQEAEAAALTGPAAELAGLFRNFVGLAAHGWLLVGASIDEIEHGSPVAARFARENVALYIESVYDGHFDLSQIDEKLRAGYLKLGGQGAFGDSLTQGEVDGLADTYSEADDRLHPHVGVRLGS